MPGLLIRTFTCPVWRAIKKEEITVVTNQVLIVVVVSPIVIFREPLFLFVSLSLFFSLFLSPSQRSTSSFCEVMDDQLFDASVDSSIAAMTTTRTTTTMIEKRNGNRSRKTMMMMMTTMLAQSSCAYCNEAAMLRKGIKHWSKKWFLPGIQMQLELQDSYGTSILIRKWESISLGKKSLVAFAGGTEMTTKRQ